MNELEIHGFKSRVLAGLTAVFPDPSVYFAVIRFEEISPKFYMVEVAINQHIMLYVLVYDGMSGCRVWLDSGSIYHILVQPALEKYTREHPWLLGV